MPSKRVGRGEGSDDEFWPWGPQEDEQPSVRTEPPAAPPPRAPTRDVLPVIGGRRVDRRVAAPSFRADERRRTAPEADRPIARPVPRRMPPAAPPEKVRLSKSRSRRPSRSRAPGFSPDSTGRLTGPRGRQRLQDALLALLALLVLALAFLVLTKS